MRGLAFLLAVAGALGAGAADFDPRDFGAKGDGVTKDTAAIQRAIDACVKAGGGRVVIANGTYLTAPIVLGSGVELHLAKGATLLPGEAGEELQAAAAVDLYRFWFSRPEIHGITWWNLMDGAAFAGEDGVKGALLDDFAREKAVYRALRNLITREFNTSFRAKTDAAGRVSFRGFRGTYSISFRNAAGNGLSSRTFEVK